MKLFEITEEPATEEDLQNMIYALDAKTEMLYRRLQRYDTDQELIRVYPLDGTPIDEDLFFTMVGTQATGNRSQRYAVNFHKYLKDRPKAKERLEVEAIVNKLRLLYAQRVHAVRNRFNPK